MRMTVMLMPIVTTQKDLFSANATLATLEMVFHVKVGFSGNKRKNVNIQLVIIHSNRALNNYF